MATIAVKDATGATQNVEVPLTPGQKNMANSRPIVIASDQTAIPIGSVGGQMPAYGSGATASNVQRVTIASDQLGPLVNNAVPVITGGFEYKACPVSATTTLGATGATGDYLEGLTIVVATAATAQVQIKDGSDAAITVFPSNPGGGIGSYYVPVGAKSRTGAWQVVTLAGSTVLATGDFT